jgi:hypothetical protein
VPAVLLTALAALVVSASTAPPALAAPASPSPTQPAAPGGSAARKATFGVQPATDGKPDGRPVITYGMTAGAIQPDHIAVMNRSLRTYTFEVYATDAINDADGDLTLLAPDKKPTDAGSWITLGGRAASGRVTVKPRSYVVVPIEVRVPDNASPGDHVAGVVASLAAVSNGQKVNVRLNQRVGARVFIRVAGPVHPGLAIDGLSVHHHNNWNPVGGGGATVTYRVRNTGNVNLGAKQRVTVSGLLGKTASATPADLPLLLPGSSVAIRVPISGIAPEIFMTAKAELTPIIPAGGTDADVSAGLKDVYSASTHFWAVPWVLLGIIGALAAGGVWFWRRRRRIERSSRRHTSGRNGRSRTAPSAKARVGA